MFLCHLFFLPSRMGLYSHRTRTRPSWILCLKKSFTVQPARPEDAQAQAQAQEEAQAQAQEWCDDPPPEPEERDDLCGLGDGTSDA